MRSPRQYFNAAALVVCSASLLAGLGCGRRAPDTFPVNGKVQLRGRDVRQLAGARVEVVQTSDLTVAAAGEVQDDGSFSLATIHAGKPLPGAPKGQYVARLVLSDEDRGSRIRRGQPVARRFSNFKTSGLSLQVPPTGDVVLSVSPR